MLKKLSVKRIQEKAIEKLEKSFEGTGIKVEKQAKDELYNAILDQPEDGMEHIIAENLAVHIVNKINLDNYKNKKEQSNERY